MPLKERQKTNTQHAVPQNIMDVEFKLIGDLTMRQFTYLVVFGLLAYIVYITVGGVFKWPLVVFFSLFGLALAFIPLQERGMDEWVVNFFRSVYSPTQRIWKKGTVLPAAFTYQSAAVVRHELIALAPTSSRRRLEEYLELQQKQTVEDKLDIPEREYIFKVRQAFTPVASAVDVEEFPKYTKSFAPSTTTAPASKEEKVVTIEGADKKKHEEEKPDHPLIRFPSIHKPRRAEIDKQRGMKSSDEFMPSIITPDRHAGRKFTRMLPSEGMLILPVRGEKIIQTSEEIDIQKDIDEKTNQLKKLLDQIRGDQNIQDGLGVNIAAPQIAAGKQEIKKAEDVVKKVKEENERLSNEIEKLRKEIESSQVSEEEKKKRKELLEKLEKEKNSTGADYSTLQKQVLELQNRLKEKELSLLDNKSNQPKAPTYAKMQAITTEPNIVSGIVRNEKQEGIQGVVLLIKNHKGESVRALKTNTLGQFSISTPLVNGIYTLEIGTGVQGLTFDIITIDVKGEVIPPIELLGREI